MPIKQSSNGSIAGGPEPSGGNRSGFFVTAEQHRENSQEGLYVRRIYYVWILICSSSKYKVGNFLGQCCAGQVKSSTSVILGASETVNEKGHVGNQNMSYEYDEKLIVRIVMVTNELSILPWPFRRFLR
jgi:hypothetical protein